MTAAASSSSSGTPRSLREVVEGAERAARRAACRRRRARPPRWRRCRRRRRPRTASCARAASRAARVNSSGRTCDGLGLHARPRAGPPRAASRCPLAAPPPASRLRMRATRTGGSLAGRTARGRFPRTGHGEAPARAGAGSGPARGGADSAARGHHLRGVPGRARARRARAPPPAATSARWPDGGQPAAAARHAARRRDRLRRDRGDPRDHRRLRRTARTSSSSGATCSTARRAATASSRPTRSVAERVGARGRRPVEDFAAPEPPAPPPRSCATCSAASSIVWGALLRGALGLLRRGAHVPARARRGRAWSPIAAAHRARTAAAPSSRSPPSACCAAASAARVPDDAAASTSCTSCPWATRRRPTSTSCRTMFETESIPAALGGRGSSASRRIWVPTQFNVDSFERGGVDPRAPARPARHDRLRPLPRRRRPVDLGETRGFTFVSNFDFQDRKGWDVLLRAYALEFAGEEDVTLLLKVHTIHTPSPAMQARVAARAAPHRPAGGAAAARRGSWPRTCPRPTCPGLYTAADAYVSPDARRGLGPAADGGAGVRHAGHRLALERPAGLPRRRQRAPRRRHASSTSRTTSTSRSSAASAGSTPTSTRCAPRMRAVRSDPAGAARARPSPPGPRLLEEFARPAIAERIAELDPRGALTVLHACTIVARNYLAHARTARGVLPRAPSRRPLHGAGDGRAVRAPAARRRRVRRHRAAPDRAAGGRARADADALRRQGARDRAQADAARLAAGRPARSAALYLDPDIVVFDALDFIGELAERHGIVLTPHTLEPLPRDYREPSEHGLNVAGVFNLGFVCVGDGGRPFLRWWAERLARDCVEARRAGPVRRPEVGRLRALLLGAPHPARPRLQRRVLEPADAARRRRPGLPGRSTATPLRFFHYSGYSPARPERAVQVPERARAASRSPSTRCCACSATTTRRGSRANGFAACSPVPYAFDAPGGLVLDRPLRRLYRQVLKVSELQGLRAAAEPVRARPAGVAGACCRTVSPDVRAGADGRPGCRRAGSPCSPSPRSSPPTRSCWPRWNAAFDADADATLVILAEGDAEEATSGVLAALERAGIDVDAAPDMLLLAAAPFELPPGRRRAGGLHPPGAARRAARPAPRRRPERARAAPPDPEHHA